MMEHPDEFNELLDTWFIDFVEGDLILDHELHAAATAAFDIRAQHLIAGMTEEIQRHAGATRSIERAGLPLDLRSLRAVFAGPGKGHIDFHLGTDVAGSGDDATDRRAQAGDQGEDADGFTPVRIDR